MNIQKKFSQDLRINGDPLRSSEILGDTRISFWGELPDGDSQRSWQIAVLFSTVRLSLLSKQGSMLLILNIVHLVWQKCIEGQHGEISKSCALKDNIELLDYLEAVEPWPTGPALLQSQ